MSSSIDTELFLNEYLMNEEMNEWVNEWMNEKLLNLLHLHKNSYIKIPIIWNK